MFSLDNPLLYILEHFHEINFDDPDWYDNLFPGDKPDSEAECEEPRLSKILGVPAKKWFTISSDRDDVKFRILEDGSYETSPPLQASSSRAIMAAIENPDLVTLVPEKKFSNREMTVLKAIYKVCPEAYLYRSKTDDVLFWDVDGSENMNGYEHNRLPWKLFPQIKHGDKVVLEDLFE